MQGLRPSAHGAKSDMADVLNVPDLLLMSEDAFTDRVADIAAFMVSIQCLGITAAALLMWLDNWWLNLPSTVKLTGRTKVCVCWVRECISTSSSHPVCAPAAAKPTRIQQTHT